MDWSSIKRRLAADATVRQLLIVEHTGGSEALARYYLKQDDGRWKLSGRCKAFIGKNGIGKTREGDAKTPVGELRPLRAFGILPNPGTVLPWIDVRPGTIACDEEGPCYNRILQLAGWGNGDQTDISGEYMWEISPEYDYGLETDFNKECVWPLGSAIFIHCKGAKSWTGGCVALEKRLMKKILTTADSGLVISIR